MKRIHFTDNYLLSPQHPVTVFVIGAGGTGSQVVTNLARMNKALQSLGHVGLHVTVFDPDTVTEANIGRQLFSESEIGLNKAMALTRGRATSSSPARTTRRPGWRYGGS